MPEIIVTTFFGHVTRAYGQKEVNRQDVFRTQNGSGEKLNFNLFPRTQYVEKSRDFASAWMQCSPLCRWGRVVPAWPWQSCPCRWFLATGSCRCGAGRLMWSWRRSSDIAACLCGPMAWTPEEKRERRCEFGEWATWRLRLAVHKAAESESLKYVARGEKKHSERLHYGRSENYKHEKEKEIHRNFLQK